MQEIIKVLFSGFGENLRIFVLTLAMAIPLGLIITFGSMTRFKPLRWLTRTFVWIIRGTPLMLQLFVVQFIFCHDYPPPNYHIKNRRGLQEKTIRGRKQFFIVFRCRASDA